MSRRCATAGRWWIGLAVVAFAASYAYGAERMVLGEYFSQLG